MRCLSRIRSKSPNKFEKERRIPKEDHYGWSMLFDIYINQSEALGQSGREIILSSLAENSHDLASPGYPYGHVKVDQLSRVSFSPLYSKDLFSVISSILINHEYRVF